MNRRMATRTFTARKITLSTCWCFMSFFVGAFAGRVSRWGLCRE